MPNYKPGKLLIVFAGTVLIMAIAQAQTYKWTDEHGRFLL
jgi:hypothetical protein